MENRRIIMIIDDDSTSLTMGKTILEQTYTVYPIPSGERFFKILTKVIPDLVLLDIEMPEMSGIEVLRRLKEDSHTQKIPVIIVSSINNPENKQEALQLGAADILVKPYSPPTLLQCIEKNIIKSV